MNFDKKPSLAFVDHSFHQKTKCTDFLKDILRIDFSVAEYWDYGWKNGAKIAANDLTNEEYVFFFQVIPPFEELQKIKAKIIWAPMYDGFNSNPLFWKKLSFLPIKILSFSAKISLYCDKYNLEKIDLRYFMNPEKYKRDLPPEGKHLFFWYRGNITFANLKNHLSGEQIDSFTIISNPDPNYQPEVISEEDKKKFKISVIKSDFENNNPYLDILSKSNIFISPRKKEGIGMSLLEALAMGMCVIANNEATMNEYIKNGENGYLFDLNDQKKIDLSNFKKMREAAEKSAAAGYAEWLKQKEKINNFILAEHKKIKTNKIIFWLDYFCLFLINKLKRIKAKAINFINPKN